MTVGDRIKKIRIEKDISQIDLATKSGISKQTLYKYENNIVTNIPLSTITSIANALNVSEAVIMGWAESGKTPEVPDYDESTIELIMLFSKLNKEQKNSILNMMRSFALDN